MDCNITPTIKYVGVDDINATLFEEQYPLPHGMSYNSYVILDEKIAVLDSVEAGQDSLWLQQIETATQGKAPDYLVVHHMEPDHSACITAILDRYPSLKLVASTQAIGMLPQFFPDYDFTGRTMAVKEGDTLPLGQHTLQFFSAPMVHWPEVMVSYEQSEQVLFSADAFGKFGALQYADDWDNEARRYYINIVGKYGPQVTRLLDKLTAPPISIIAPLHGPVITENPMHYVDLYRTWSAYRPECQGVLVAYASIYGGTADAAQRIAEMLRQTDADEIVTINLCRADQSEAIAQAFRLSSMIVASPTYDAGLYPAMHDFLYHLSIKNYRNRRVGIIENGSWAPIAAKVMRKMLEPLPQIEIIDPVVTIRSRINDSSLQQLQLLAQNIAKK